MSVKCATCKHRVVGKFNHLYGGCPIGCNKPEDKREWVKTNGKDCYEPEEEKENDRQRENGVFRSTL